MSKKAIAPPLGDAPVFIKRDRAVTSSREVARVFHKRHRHVLETIRNLECSEAFGRSNFRLTNYTDEHNREQPEYLITRDGFSILAMGYTGKKAMAFKEWYIARFNAMERLLLERRGEEWQTARRVGILARKDETAVISQLVAYAKTQKSKHAEKLYVVYTRLANKIAGVISRDTADTWQLLKLRLIEGIIEKVILLGMAAAKHYKAIYQDCKAQMERYEDALLLNVAAPQLAQPAP